MNTNPYCEIILDKTIKGQPQSSQALFLSRATFFKKKNSEIELIPVRLKRKNDNILGESQVDERWNQHKLNYIKIRFRFPTYPRNSKRRSRSSRQTEKKEPRKED